LKFALDHAQVNEQSWWLPHDAAQPAMIAENGAVMILEI
jgi:hypothetical protein